MNWSRDEVAEPETDKKVLFVTWSHHSSNIFTVHTVRCASRQARLWNALHTSPDSWVVLPFQEHGCLPPAHVEHSSETRSFSAARMGTISGTYLGDTISARGFLSSSDRKPDNSTGNGYCDDSAPSSYSYTYDSSRPRPITSIPVVVNGCASSGGNSGRRADNKCPSC